ncbi:hypothetical protein SEPCBS119000_004637 [Sporothrix epigloea]|uniref:Protein kinase domain-containing protein n=1 Tax=Sporothrix epigloea TaxID=1892477 RepID=A0ABP0DVE9_9PEZI
MVWYDADRIQQTVTRQFVCSQLLPEEIARLDRPLAFGDGLTDGTYWEWIEERAKRIFLILVDLHVPDQIFGVIDDSWDDEDLPIAQEQVERLALTASHNARFDRKFYRRQYYYLLKPLERSDRVVVYEDEEIVPLDLVDSIGSDGGSSSSNLGGGDRVVLPSYPGMVFARRRIPLAPLAGSAYGSGQVTLEDFEWEVSSIKTLQNEHLVSFFAAYVHQGYGYVLFTPAADGSIKSFLATTPAFVRALTVSERYRLIFDWIHCLVDTLCFVHSRGLSHGNIKPSTVFFGHQHSEHRIFFADFTHFGVDMKGGIGHDKASFDKESYDYAAPEQWYRPSAISSSGGVSGGSVCVGASTSASASSRRSTLTGEGGPGGRGAGIKLYATSVYSSSSSNGSNGSNSSVGGRDIFLRSRHRHSSGGENARSSRSVSADEHRPTTSGFAIQTDASPRFCISRSSTTGSGGDGHRTSAVGGGSGTPVPQLNPQAADVFSLGCIILELLSFVMKRQTRSFATHRAARHKSAGRGGAVLDSSFHKNLGQVENWMAGLARDAASTLDKRRTTESADDDGGPTLAGVTPMLHVVERMLALHASERPSVYDVQKRMYQVLRDHCDVAEPHCVHEYGGYTTESLERGGHSTAYGSSNGSTSQLPSATMAMSPTPTSVTRAYSWSSSSGAASPAGTPFRNSSHHLGPRLSRRTVSGRPPAAAQHTRHDSGSGESVRSGVIGGASAIPEESESGSSTGSSKGGGGLERVIGLHVIRNLQIRDKVRQSWKSAVYAA